MPMLEARQGAAAERTTAAAPTQQRGLVRELVALAMVRGPGKALVRA